MNNEPAGFFIVPLIVAGFLIIFPLFWLGIVLLISKIGGWTSLARAYPAETNATGKAFNWHSARLNFLTSYRSCMNFTVSHEGLHMVPMVLFRMWHPPIMIPWEKIGRFETKDFWLTCSCKLTINPSPDATKSYNVVVYGRDLVNAIEEQLTRTRL